MVIAIAVVERCLITYDAQWYVEYSGYDCRWRWSEELLLYVVVGFLCGL